MFPTYAPAIDFDGGKYGVGMLSKEKPVSYRYIALPGREEERVLLWVEFERYIFCCTHLSLTPEDRMLSLPILRREAAFAHKPLFIAGDWNATAHSPFITEISKDFQLLSNPKQATFPASTPDSCLDYIAGYVKNGQPFTRLSAWVPEEAVASDHRPVVTEVRLKPITTGYARKRSCFIKPIRKSLARQRYPRSTLSRSLPHPKRISRH